MPMAIYLCIIILYIKQIYRVGRIKCSLMKPSQAVITVEESLLNLVFFSAAYSTLTGSVSQHQNGHYVENFQ